MNQSMGRFAIICFLLTISTIGCNPFRDTGGEALVEDIWGTGFTDVCVMD